MRLPDYLLPPQKPITPEESKKLKELYEHFRAFAAKRPVVFITAKAP